MSKITADDFGLKNLPRLAFKVFSSYLLATTVLVFMTIITLFGTLYQVDYGLFAAKKAYFESWGVILYLNDVLPISDSMKWIGTIPIPLPGGFLLMSLLTTNIIIGAIVKVRKRAKGIGMLIAHSGIIFLLVSGFVTQFYATDGYMALYEGQSGNRWESYRTWQLEILPLDDKGNAEKAMVIPHGDLESIRSGEQRVFQSTDLPFDLVVSEYVGNAVPVPVSAPISAQASGREIEGFKLLVQKPAKEAEQNLPALIATFRPKSNDAKPIETILSARSANFDPREKPMAFGFEMAGKKWAARMVKETLEVPFTVRLDKFIFERHPGVSTARNYESRITRIEDGTEKAVEIKMNEPMRHAGYTFFQESFGPSNARPGEPMYSQFAVANNPADQWPLYSLLVTTTGLLIHFGIKLSEHLSRPRKNLPPPIPGAAT